MLKDIVKLSAEDRSDLIRIVTGQLQQQGMRLTPAFIEKDLWVTFMLQVIFQHSKYRDNFDFKGGTSLSKGFDAIARFSEDIDLILDWGLLGYTSDEIMMERSRTQQNKLFEVINLRAGKWLEDYFIPELESVVDTLGVKNISFRMDDDGQTVIVDYPHSNEDAAILPIIRLEVGPLAARTPTEDVAMTTYMSNAKIDWGSFTQEPVMVRTVSPKRTFWEKATILHGVANKNNRVPMRYSRHYYDLYQLAHIKQIKDDAFSDFTLLDVVAAFKGKFYHSAGAHYESANIASLRLVPSDEIIELLRKDYAAMENMMLQEPPALDDIMCYLAELEEEIHGLNY
jgi:hypothetical protein